MLQVKDRGTVLAPHSHAASYRARLPEKSAVNPGQRNATGLQDHNTPVRGGHAKSLVLALGMGRNTANTVTPPVTCPITGLPATYERLRLTFLPLMYTERGAEAA